MIKNKINCNVCLKEIVKYIRPNTKYCSKNCSNIAKIKKQMVVCLNCNLFFYKHYSEIKKTPNHFCSKSCSSSYNNKHKKYGNSRSKLEIWIEKELNNLYENIEIHYNRKDTIGSELDIYIPSLKLAFELNGIFHYEPIFGSKTLNNVKNNDISKSKACLDNKIDLCVIDTTGQKYFKEATSKKYLDIIINIINERI